MQQPDEEPLHTEILPSIVLQYPTIKVYGTPASWLSQSQLVTMASNPDDSSCDDTLSSLGDSTYDFVDDKSTVVSDDEDQGNSNQSVSSNDVPEIELPNNHRQRRTSINDEASRSFRSHSFSLSFNPEDSHTTESQSTYEETTRNNDGFTAEDCGDLFAAQKQKRQQNLELQEFLVPGGYSEGSHLMKVFKGTGISEVLHHTHLMTSSSQVIATARQLMTDHGLVPNEPYKVLYIGDSSAKDPIVQKIGSALAATLKSERVRRSRFNVVPISSFGDSMSPDVVLIDSTGLELSVEDCVSASFAKQDGGKDTISMTLSDQTLVKSFWSRAQFTITDEWKLPDLAVFYLSDNDNISAKQTRRFAQSFMTRHIVPSIFISQTPLWNRPMETVTFDRMDRATPHICLEAYSSDGKRFEIVDRLPIDIQTFVSIDARQMNRNLASLSMNYNISRMLKDSPVSRSELGKDSKIKTKGRASLVSFPHLGEPRILENLPFTTKALVSGLVFVLGFLLYHFALASVFNASQTSVLRQSPAGTAQSDNLVFPRPTSAVSISTSAGSSNLPSLTSPATKQHPDLRSKSALQTNTEIASFLLDGHAVVPNKSEKFKINVIGDSHIVLRPPHWFIRSRKASKLLFSVSRGNSVLTHKVSTLFDGVFAIEIPREDAYGMLNVSVWTTSKPKINENFDVEFRTPWFGFATWKKTENTITKFLRKNFISVDTIFISACKHSNAALQLFIHGAQEKAGKFRNEVGKIGMASLHRTTKSKEIVLAQTMGMSRSLTRKLGRGSLAASKKIVLYADHLCNEIVLYITQKSLMVSRQAQQLPRAAFSIDLRSFANGALEYKNGHIRATQKKALKMWWKIRGVPKHEPAQVGVNGKTKARNAGSKKWTSR